MSVKQHGRCWRWASPAGCATSAGSTNAGNAIDVRDPLSDKIRAIVDASSDTDRVHALLGLSEVFGHDLAQNSVFIEAVSEAYQRIARRGARQAVIETLNL